MSDSGGNKWWVAAEVALAASIVALPWCFGGAPEWTLWILVTLATVACGLWLLGAALQRRRWTWHPVLVLPVAASAFAVLQLVPLPPHLLAALSQPAAELREFALVPLGLDRWRPVSLDPPSTARALARSLALGGLLFTALQLGRQEHARQRLFAVVGLVGVSVAVCGFGHLVASEELLFGVHRFSGNVPVLTPFGNTNHLASFLTLTGTVALGLALNAKARDASMGWGVSALAIGVAVFLSMSRGGIGVFVATWGAVAALVVVRRSGGLRGAAPWVTIGATVTVACLLALEELVDRIDTVSTLQKLHTTKVELWPAFFSAARPSALMGMGRGAFELGFSRYQHTQLDETFTHPENVALQWLTEVGFPMTLALCVAAVVVGLRVWGATRGRVLERVATVGLLGVLLHDVFDFALELNAVPAVAAVVLGLAASASPGDGRRTVRTRTLAFGVAPAVVAFVAAAHGLPSHLVAEQRLAAALQDPVRVREVQPLALSLIDRHPSDYVFYANMANFATSRGDARDALAWVNRVLFLRPDDAHAHATAGRALLRLGRRTQALLEFRTSFELGDRSALPLALAVAAKEGDFQRVLVTTPGFLAEAWRTLVAREQDAPARALLEVALDAGPSDAVRLEARVLLAELTAQTGEPAEALNLLDALPAEVRERPSFVATRSRVLWKLGRTEEAAAALARRLTAEPDSVELALLLSDIYAATGRDSLARDVLVRIRPLVSSPATRIDLLLREAAILEAGGRLGKALDAVQTASRLAPGRPDLHYQLARIYERMGLTRAAIDEVRRGRVVDTADGARARDQWLGRLIEKESAALGAPPSPTTP